MIPLLLSSLLVVAIIFERSINLRASKVLSPTTVERVSGLVEGGRVDKAVSVCKEHPGLFSSIVLAGLEIAGRGEATAKEAVEDAGRHETARLSRYLTALGTIAAVAPLMGVFGTVVGMLLGWALAAGTSCWVIAYSHREASGPQDKLLIPDTIFGVDVPFCALLLVGSVFVSVLAGMGITCLIQRPRS